VVEALERGVPADGGPALKQTADIRLGQTVTRVELVDHGVAVHVQGQVGCCLVLYFNFFQKEQSRICFLLLTALYASGSRKLSVTRQQV
jgi:hypothetical protein